MAGVQWKSAAGQVAMALAVTAVVVFFYKIFKVRILFYRLRKQGLVRLNEPSFLLLFNDVTDVMTINF
jgi:hypothetical protein